MEGRPFLHRQGGVDARPEPLGGGLLVAGGAVDLSRQIQPIDGFRLQGLPQLARLDEIILDGIGAPHDFGLPETRNGADDLFLDFQGKAVPQALGVDFLRVKPLELEDHGMAFLVGKPHDLVLQGRAIAGAHPPDRPRVQGRSVDVLPDEAVGFPRGMAEEGGKPLGAETRRPVGKGFEIGVAVLPFQNGKIDGGCLEPRRRARFHPPHFKAQIPETPGQGDRGDFPGPSRGLAGCAHVDQPVQKGSRGDHNGGGTVEKTGGVHDARDAPPLHDDPFHQGLAQVEVFLLFHHRLHGQAVELLVALHPGGLDRRSLGAVENPEMDGRTVGDFSHLAAQGVHFLDQLAFGKPPDGGVAGHEGDAVQADIEQEGAASHPGGGQGGLAAGVTRPDNDHITGFHDPSFRSLAPFGQV